MIRSRDKSPAFIRIDIGRDKPDLFEKRLPAEALVTVDPAEESFGIHELARR